MTTRRFELAMRIRADLEQAERDVRALEQSLERVEKAGTAAARGLDKAAAGASKLGDSVSRQREITAEIERRARVEADANARNKAALREYVAEYDRIAAKRADAMAAFSAATPEQLRTPQERTADIGRAQSARRDAELRMLEINRRADALEAKLTTTRSGLSNATARAAKTAQTAAISAGQTQQAMRQLPAQITDVTTSLASGQPIWLVAIQQGGQIKDSFGGIGPAFRAVTGAVTPMAAAVTVGIAAIAGIALAAYQGYQQIRQLEGALISSGNVAGATAGQLAEIRDEIAATSGAYGDAQAAVATLAASGRITVDTLDAAAAAALNLSELTGRSIEDTTDEIIRLAKSPTAVMLELNDKYHFLTAATYEQVAALERQGQTQEAVKVILEELSRESEKRVQEMRDQAGALEKAWLAVSVAVRGVWQAIRDVGRDDLEARLAAQTRATNAAVSVLQGYQRSTTNEAVLGIYRRRVLEEKAQLDALIADRDAAQKKARAEAERVRLRDEGNRARAAIDAKIDAGLDNESKKKKALIELERTYQKLRADDPNDRRLSNGSYEAQVRAINEQFKGPKAPKPKKTEGQRADDAAQREIENLKQQVAMLDALEDGETRAAEAARIRYEIEQGAFRNASPALKQQLQENAQLLDSERKKIELAKQLVDVRMRTLQLEGRGDEASLQKTIQNLEVMRRKLIEVGDTAGVAQIAKLMQLEQANAQMQELQRSFSAFNSRLSEKEQRVNIARENGLISSIEAQRQLLALRQEEIVQIQAMIPQLEAAAVAMSGFAKEETLAKIDALKTQLFELQAQGSLIETTFRNTFESGLADALTGLATGTLTLKQALTGLIQDLISGMARLAAQQLASMATAKVMAALFRGKGQSADVGEGAGKLQTAALATGLAGGVIKLGADSLSQAAKELTTAATLMIVANSMGGFAEGGYTGPGGKYQVAGYVHRGEYVQPQERMRESGALPFMRMFHQHGMEAIDRWRGYADGGLVTAPSLLPAPRFSFAEGGLANGQLPAPQLNMRLVNLVDSEDLVGGYLDTPAGERKLVNVIGRNAATIRQLVNS